MTPSAATTAALPVRRPVLSMRRFLGAGSVMLLLILAGVPGAEGGDVATLNIVHTRITAAFDGARASAVESMRSHGVAIDVVGDRFVMIDDRGQVVQEQDLDAGSTTSMDVFATVAVPASLRSLGADVVSAHFGEGGTIAVFGPDGIPLAGGTVRVKIGNTPVTWVLDAATGRLLPAQD